MLSMMWLLSVFCLPLFPLSMGFNALFARLRHPLLRTAMLLIWPQVGVVALSLVTTPIPGWVLALAVTTSILYGVRALALRELGLWASFLATSGPAAPAAAAGVAVSWLVGSWAGARLLQGMIVGPGRDCDVRDLSRAATWGYASVLVLLVVAGLSWMGGLS